MPRWPFCLLLLLLAACKPAGEARITAIIGAVLIDGNGGPPVTDSVVVVSGGRIRSAGPRASVPIPAGSVKVNAAGIFLVPGLIDLHVHLGSRAGPDFRAADYTAERIRKNLTTYLYFGVTTVRSAGTDREAGFEVRKAQRERLSGEARLFTAGRGFTAPGGNPTNVARQPASPDDARRQVAELAGQQVDLIKIWVDDGHRTRPKIQPAVIEAILDEARRLRIPVVAHIATLADTQFLVDAGATGFLHMIRDTEDLDPGFLARLRALRLVFAPTLVRQELAWLYTEKPELLAGPDVARTVDADVIAAVREAARGRKAPPRDREEFERARRNTRRLAAAGVPVGVGSDGGSPSDFPGLMTHREIELLVEAGLTPVEAITAATRHGALALGKLDELGTIEPGKRADLLLLRGNPLEDVRHLRRISRLMLDGEWVNRDGLVTE